MISLAVLGRLASAAPWSENVEERRKAVFAHLREGPAMIAWDNLPRGAGVSCPVIEQALTAAAITDRVLGHSEQVSVPAATVHFFTGNNIVPARDMASRSLVIHLDVDRPDPENREFQHPDPLAWTIQHRARILRALYTLLVWNPLLKLDAKERQPKTRFKRWWTLCAAPIESVAGIDFGEILRARESEDAETSGVSALLHCLREAFGDEQFTAEQVAGLANGHGLDLETKVPCSMQAALEEATAKPFPRGGVLDGQKVGKRLQMIVGRPAQVSDRVLTLQRIANAKTGNRYRVAASG
jgi:hypothetical protein